MTNFAIILDRLSVPVRGGSLLPPLAPSFSRPRRISRSLAGESRLRGIRRRYLGKCPSTCNFTSIPKSCAGEECLSPRGVLFIRYRDTGIQPSNRGGARPARSTLSDSLELASTTSCTPHHYCSRHRVREVSLRLVASEPGDVSAQPATLAPRRSLVRP